jgi:hypothetical protein
LLGCGGSCRDGAFLPGGIQEIGDSSATRFDGSLVGDCRRLVIVA